MSKLGLEFINYMQGKDILLFKEFLNMKVWNHITCNHIYLLFYDSDTKKVVKKSNNRCMAYLYLEYDNLKFFKKDFEKFEKLKSFI